MTVDLTPHESIKVVAGDGLMLKQMVSEDAEAVFSLIDLDRDYLKHLDEDLVEKYKTAAAVRMSITVPDNPNNVPIAIWENNKVIGGMNLQFRPGHIADLSFWTGRRYEGQTHGVRAIKMLTEYAFRHLEITRLVSFVQPGNKAAENVLKEVGFIHLGIVFINRKPRWEYELRHKIES
jgi:RimJ/RimL family protein N-acetyltransferase